MAVGDCLSFLILLYNVLMNEIQYVSSELLNSIGVKHGWFMRYGGVSGGLFNSLNGKKGSGDADKNVDENRRRALLTLFPGCHPGSDTMHIVHAFKTDILGADKPGEYSFYDASFTDKKDLVLSQTTADCASIIIGDTNKKIVSLIHGSWHTLKENIICDTVAELKTTPNIGELYAGIGPMICKNCYQFGPEAKELFESRYLTPILRNSRVDGNPLQINSVRGTQNKYLVALKQMVINQLNESGITKIDDLNMCTKEDERFFSHRRDGACSGRMITLTSLTDVIS